MASIRTGDYMSQIDHEIVGSSLTARIEELRKAPLGLDDEAYELTEDEEDELAALRAFRDEVEQVTGNHFDEATIVPAEEFTEHARDWAHGIADLELVDTFVDWEKFADSLKNDAYKPLAFGDDEVWVR